MAHSENEDWMKTLDKVRHIVRIADATLIVLIGGQLDPLIG
jgi:hypothetical protein